MTIGAPLWIFPLLPGLLTVFCLAAVWWALTQMAPLRNTPVERLRLPDPPRKSPPLAATAAPTISPPAAPTVGQAFAPPASGATMVVPPASGATMVVPPASGATMIVPPAPGAATIAPDNLEIIEGVGPKIAAALRAAGIPTLAALGETEVSRLRQILAAADLNLVQPETWPAQARLAAAGQLDALNEMQAQLRAGRKI